MALSFTAGGPALRPEHLADWLGTPPGVHALSATRTTSEPYQVVDLTLDQVLEGRLPEPGGGGRWRYLILDGGVPRGELEFDHGRPVAFHRGLAKDGLVRAMAAADAVDGDFDVCVVHAPAIRFVALWLHNAEEDWLVPYPPSAAGLEPCRAYRAADALPQLRARAEEVGDQLARGGDELGG